MVQYLLENKRINTYLLDYKLKYKKPGRLRLDTARFLSKLISRFIRDAYLPRNNLSLYSQLKRLCRVCRMSMNLYQTEHNNNICIEMSITSLIFLIYSDDSSEKRNGFIMMRVFFIMYHYYYFNIYFLFCVFVIKFFTKYSGLM